VIVFDVSVEEGEGSRMRVKNTRSILQFAVGFGACVMLDAERRGDGPWMFE